MKKIIYGLLICFAVLSTGFSQTSKQSVATSKVNTVQTNKQQKKTVSEKVVYTCPMHPEVLTDKPGKCPKCGMDMVEKKEVKKDGTKKKPTAKEKPMSM